MGSEMCIRDRFNPALVKFKEFKVKKEGHEIIAAAGKIVGDKRTFVIYSIYLPPNLSKAKSERAFELINESVTQAKTTFENPIVILGGDFNQFGVNNCISDHPEILAVNSPPTRKDAKLDLFATNVNQHIKNCFVTVPCLLYTSPSPRDLSTSRMPSSA